MRHYWVIGFSPSLICRLGGFLLLSCIGFVVWQWTRPESHASHWASCVLGGQCKMDFYTIDHLIFFEVCLRNHCEKKSIKELPWQGFELLSYRNHCLELKIEGYQEKGVVKHCFVEG